MSARLLYDISKVSSGCLKPSCKWAALGYPTSRHHTGSEKIFVNKFRILKGRSDKFKAFEKRYWLYHKDDIVHLCTPHHAEIHALYWKVIQYHLTKLRKPMYRWSWREADKLMSELRRVCKRWLKEPSDGIPLGFDDPVFRRLYETHRESHKRS